MKLAHQLLLVHVFVTIICTISAVNTLSKAYCQTPHCRNLNLACNNQGTLNNCPRRAKLLDMAKYMNPLAHLFNTLRNDVAGGQYRNLPKAARMGRMTWSRELASFARLDISRCRLLPRPCMSSPSFYYIGHMADKIVYMEYEKDRGNFAMMSELIEHWTSEITGISRTDTLTLPNSFEKPLKYKSTLLINERNSQFGCAALRYTLTGYNYFYFSCAFATDNLIDRPIFKWGATSGNQCRHRDKIYKNLCGINEDYQNEKFTKNGGAYADPIDI